MKVLILHWTLHIEMRIMFNMMKILHVMIKVERIKMKVFLTH
jgi:hypothetical protein